MTLWLAACGGLSPSAAPPATEESQTVATKQPTTTGEPDATVTPTDPVEPSAPEQPTAAVESQPTATPQPTAIDGAALLQDRCASCHGLSRITEEDGTREEWDQVVRDMVSKGARLSADEITVLVDYLAATYADS